MLVAVLNEPDDVRCPRLLEKLDALLGNCGRGRTVAEAIDHRNERALVETTHAKLIAGITMAVGDRPRSRPLDARVVYG